MKKNELVFTVNGAEKRIDAAELVMEVFQNKDGTQTTKWNSGKSVITDKFEGDKWLHKKIYDKNGQLESELTRVFDGNKLISVCEDCTDGTRKCSLYEYDDKNQLVYQKEEKLCSNGTTSKIFERWFKNFNEGTKYDVSELTSDKNICYRELDSENRVVHFVDSEIEGRNEYLENGDSIFTTFKSGKIRTRNSSYKSDDGLVNVNKNENFEDKTVYYEVKDTRKSSENPERIYAVYMYQEKM